MHESVHYGSFKTRWMADVLAFFSGAAILNNAGFYRHYHMAHHRYTQDPARDPELVTSGTPRTWGQYLFRVSSIPFLMLRVRDIFLFPFGFRGERRLHPSRGLARGAALGALAAGFLCGADRGLDRAAGATRCCGCGSSRCWSDCRCLRLYLLCEHTLCPNSDDGFANTRTTLSNPDRALPDVEPTLSRRASSVPQHRLPSPARGASASAAASEVCGEGVRRGARRNHPLPGTTLLATSPSSPRSAKRRILMASIAVPIGSGDEILRCAQDDGERLL